jgi:L-ascorbate metabolism protein UlaG (beta-lactamase superfamily)
MSFRLASTIQALLAPGARHRNDASAFADSSVERHAEQPPKGLELEWLGTAGFRFRYEGFDLLVDPYLTRPDLLRTLGRGPLHPSERLVARHVPKADAVLVGHTHLDHALDVPLISRMFGATVYGSSSLANLMHLYGLGERAVEVVPGRTLPIGPFEVTFVESIHAKLLAGLAVPFDGELSCEHLDDLRGTAYRCGQVFGIHVAVAGATFYHLGSANFLDDRLTYRGVDYFLCGIAGRGYTPHYVERILRRLSPRIVIPHHLDDFFRPLDGEMGFSLNVNLGGFVDDVRRVSTDFQVRTIPIGTVWGRS